MRLELTRRADYAVRASLALARSTGTLRSGRYLADATNIPPRFVAQVMGDLVAAGLVEGRTGRAGGYRLARPAGEVSLLEVVEAVEGDARRRTCVLRSSPCSRDGVCEVHHIFSAAQDALLARLADASLASVGASWPAGGPSVEPTG
ncbi:Rrf2 family transcriptional regulator [soil metagenome]